MEYILLFAGAVLGVVFDRLWDSAWPVLKARNESRRRQDHAARASLVPQTALPAVGSGLAQASIATGSGGAPLPLLRAAAVRVEQVLAPFDHEPLRYVWNEPSFSPDEAALRRFTSVTGRRVFDGVACFVSDPATLFTEPSVAVSSMDYKQYIGIYENSLGARGKRDFFDQKKWDRWAGGFLQSVEAGTTVLAVGCAAGLVHQRDGVWEVMQHKRSSEVAITPGLRSVIPVFGIEPSHARSHESSLGLLQYNLIREVGEELFSIPELGAAVHSKRFDPDWMLSSVPVRRFLDDWLGGEIEVVNFGPVVNLVTVNVQYMIGIVRRRSIWDPFLADAVANWEVGQEPGAASMRFAPVGELAARWAAGETDTSPASVLLDSELAKYLEV